VSPLWRDRIAVELSPHRVVWVRMARGLRPNVAAKGIEDVSPKADGPLWQSALDQFKQMVSKEAWKDAEVDFVLSNHFVRYDCLPWNEGVKHADELLALARHRMTNIYGADAQTWALRLSPADKGAARLVAAVDDALIESIKLAVIDAKLKLHSIQPYMMSSFNRYAKVIDHPDGWFVAAEDGRFALALFSTGQWKYMQLRRGAGIKDLLEWLERENLASGGDKACREVYMFAPELHKEDALSGYQLHRLELPACDGYSPISDTQYAIAMSGIA